MLTWYGASGRCVLSRRTIICAALIGMLSSAAMAGPLAMPDDEEIRETMSKVEKLPPAKTIQEKIQEQDIGNKSTEVFNQITPDMMNNHPGKDVVNINASKTNIDLDQFADRYRDLDVQKLANNGGSQPKLYVFVSLSMPRESINRIVDDAERVHSILVLRGFVGKKFKDTVKTVKEVIGDRKIGIVIDPRKYEMYHVSQVPTTVLAVKEVLGCSRQKVCIPNENDYFSVEGDVSLQYALEKIISARPQAKEPASKFLDRLRGADASL